MIESTKRIFEGLGNILILKALLTVTNCTECTVTLTAASRIPPIESIRTCCGI